jgi:hypothetical protein
VPPPAAWRLLRGRGLRMRGRFAGVFAALALAMGLSVLATSAYARLSSYTFTILADNGPGSPFQSFYVSRASTSRR